MTHSEEFFSAASRICRDIDLQIIEAMVLELVQLKHRGGRLFLIGVGGSAANCGHAVNDFRKLCGVEAYAPTDNVAEITARTNDEGWDTVFAGWLDVSRLNSKDAIMVLSVGGGDIWRNISANIAKAISFAKDRGATAMGIVGRKDGHTARYGDLVLVVPQANSEWITPLSEAFQAVVWHCIVSHPILHR